MGESYPQQHTPWRRGISWEKDETGMLSPFLDDDGILLFDELDEAGSDEVDYLLLESVAYQVNNFIHWMVVNNIK